MKTKITVFLKDYECYAIEQAGRAKGTRYKAYGTFDGLPIEAQGSSIDSALRKLEQKAEIVLG